jgi:hypothetical protein
MQQQWLSVAGLCLDIAGVSIVFREWWLAHRQAVKESAQDESARIAVDAIQSEYRDRPHSLGRALQEIAVVGFEIHAIASIRLYLVRIAAALIIMGFIAQVFGSWPGGIPNLDIRPAP